MVFKDTCDGRRIDRPYLVFARMADLSSCSINIRHKALAAKRFNLLSLSSNRPVSVSTGRLVLGRRASGEDTAAAGLLPAR
jgi:hypothetical protein